MENGEEKKENLKGKGGQLKIKGEKVWKWFFSSSCHLLKPLKIENGQFLPGKSYFTPGKLGKTDFAPSEKYSSYATGL